MLYQRSRFIENLYILWRDKLTNRIKSSDTDSWNLWAWDTMGLLISEEEMSVQQAGPGQLVIHRENEKKLEPFLTPYPRSISSG